jgi:hypothetical protein
MRKGKQQPGVTSAAVLDPAAIAYARKTIDSMFGGDSASLGKGSMESGNFPAFALNEVALGKVLGKGGFGTVSEVLSFSTQVKQKSVLGTKRDQRQHLVKQSSNSSNSSRRIGSNGSRRSIFLGMSRKEAVDYYDYQDCDHDAEAAAHESRQFIAEHCIRQPSGDPAH